MEFRPMGTFRPLPGRGADEGCGGISWLRSNVRARTVCGWVELVSDASQKRSGEVRFCEASLTSSARTQSALITRKTDLEVRRVILEDFAIAGGFRHDRDRDRDVPHPDADVLLRVRVQVDGDSAPGLGH